MKILPQVFYFMQKAAGMLQKSSHHMVTAFWYGQQDLFAFCRGQNSCSARSSPRRQQSTGLLHLDYSSPVFP